MVASSPSVMGLLDLLFTTPFILYGYMSGFFLSFTVSRLFMVGALLPIYLAKTYLQVLPTVLGGVYNLLSLSGRKELIQNTEGYRQAADRRAESHLQDSFAFKDEDLYRVQPHGRGWMNDIQWSDRTEEVSVGGAAARYVHLSPTDGQAPRRPIVFLHGNPSWSYTWRNVLPYLVSRGHEVYALDWLGHGRSDKITCPERITFELHMRTLIEFFESTRIGDAVIVAHDWGGCVALCTIPKLRPRICTGLYLLNSFLPPRPSDMSLYYGLMYAIWFLSTGILGSYIPESGIMRYMCPQMSRRDIEGYGAPYKDWPLNSKSSLYRFGHIVPGTPRVVLRSLRNTWPWELCEGLCGPEKFDNLSQQARLSSRDDEVRRFWKNWNKPEPFKVAVVFGDRDPLLKGYKDLLVQAIDPKLMVEWAPSGIWIGGGGHYPVEEKPNEIALLVQRFADDMESK